MKHRFPFNQPDKTRDCGYRCAYYCLDLTQPYSEWIKNFEYFNPTVSGIYFNDICDILKHHKKTFKFTEVSDKGLHIIFSGIWLHPEGKKHSHYFVYEDGVVLCSTHAGPYKMTLPDVIKRLEADSVDHAYRCLKIG